MLILEKINKLFKNKMIYKLNNLWLKFSDPLRISELNNERVVYNQLQKNGLLNQFKNKRIVEIGPKHGQDSFLLAKLNPSEIVLIDLPEKKFIIDKWYSSLANKVKAKYIKGNILYLTEDKLKKLGKFDLVWCLGVLYHNVEQLRLLKKLYNLCNVNGRLVIESATTRREELRDLNVVEICWPKFYRGIQTVTHLPSRLAIVSWLEMVGFKDVRILNVYSKKLRSQRAVITGVKKKNSSQYINYSASMKNPIYNAGEAK